MPAELLFHRMKPVMTMETIRKGFAAISGPAYETIIRTLQLCAAMLFCSLALLLRCGGLHPDTYELYRTAAALQSESAAVLLLGNAGALLLEHLHSR